MSRVPLSDEETRVIFAGEAAAGFGELDATDQEAVVRKLLNIVENEAAPSALVYEQIANLDIYAVGDQCRLYTKVVDEIPRGNTEYHVVFLFYIDPAHDYPQKTLAEYSLTTEAKTEEATALASVSDVEEYFREHDALDGDDLRDLLPQEITSLRSVTLSYTHPPRV